MLALIAGKILLPTSRDPEQPPLDIPGALLSIVGLGSLVYGIIEGPSHGWLSGESLLIFGLSAVVLALFGWRELTARHPMLDLHLFRDRRFSVASGGMTLVFFAMFGTFFLVSQYFQLVLGYSAFASGSVPAADGVPDDGDRTAGARSRGPLRRRAASCPWGCCPSRSGWCSSRRWASTHRSGGCTDRCSASAAGWRSR